MQTYLRRTVESPFSSEHPLCEYTNILLTCTQHVTLYIHNKHVHTLLAFIYDILFSLIDRVNSDHKVIAHSFISSSTVLDSFFFNLPIMAVSNFLKVAFSEDLYLILIHCKLIKLINQINRRFLPYSKIHMISFFLFPHYSSCFFNILTRPIKIPKEPLMPRWKLVSDIL